MCARARARVCVCVCVWEMCFLPNTINSIEWRSSRGLTNKQYFANKQYTAYNNKPFYKTINTSSDLKSLARKLARTA